MISRLTGGLRPWQVSLDGRLHDAQPPASIAIAAQQLGQNGQPLVEPGAFFVDGSYGIRINSWSSLAGIVITVRARFLNADGRIVNNEWMHTPNSNRTKATNDFPLGVGFPLNITCFASTGSPLIGQTFVQVQIISGLGGATTLLGTLLQDYVTAAQALAYPGSPIRSSIEGGGVLRQIAGTLPGAGVELAETVPTGARWELIAFFDRLVTNATVINRLPQLQISTSGTVTLNCPQNTLETASATWFNQWGQGLTSITGAAGAQSMGPIPNGLTLVAGQIILTLTLNLQAGDQWAQPQYYVREYLEAAA